MYLQIYTEIQMHLHNCAVCSYLIATGHNSNACAQTHRGFFSPSSFMLNYILKKHWRLWQDCAGAQNHLCLIIFLKNNEGSGTGWSEPSLVAYVCRNMTWHSCLDFSHFQYDFHEIFIKMYSFIYEVAIGPRGQIGQIGSWRGARAVGCPAL